MYELRASLHPTGVRTHRMFPSRIEVRDAMSDHPIVGGYASVFGVEYEVWDWLGPYTEEVTDGAFTKTLAEQDDVRMFYNHGGLVLARTKAGSLQLTQDQIGLFYEGTMDGRMTPARDLAIAVENRNVDQSSFMFEITRQEWNGDYTKCWIKEVKLWDVSPVAFPASESTTAGMRMGEVLLALRSASPELVAAELARVGQRDAAGIARELAARFGGLPILRADEEAEEAEEVTELQALQTQLEASLTLVQKMLQDEAEEAGESGTAAAAATPPTVERDEPETMDAETARRLTEMYALRQPA